MAEHEKPDNKALMDLRSNIMREISNLVATKPSLTPNEINNAKEAVCLIEKIDEVLRKNSDNEEYETSEGRRMMYYPNAQYSYGWYDPYMHDGYAYGDDHMSGRRYSRGDWDTHSMMRGRDAAAERYVSRGEDMYNSGRMVRGSFSYDNGRSGHSIDDRVVDQLERMMDSAKSDYERHKLNQYIRVVESMKGED